MIVLWLIGLIVVALVAKSWISWYMVLSVIIAVLMMIR